MPHNSSGSLHESSLAAASAILGFVILTVRAVAVAQAAPDARLSVDRAEISLGEAVSLQWSVTGDVRSVYISSIGSEGSLQAGNTSGSVSAKPSASQAFVLIGSSPAGMLFRTVHVSVRGARGPSVLLEASDLGCTIDIPLTRPLSLDAIVGVRTVLNKRQLSVDQEFVRGAAEFVIQTKPAPQTSPAPGPTRVRDAIHQVALAMNLIGTAARTGDFVTLRVGSQLRARRVQEAEWEIETDSQRCHQEAAPLEQGLKVLLKG